MAPAQKLGRNLLCPGGKRGKKRGEGGREGGKEKKRRTRALRLFFRHSSGRFLFEFPLKFDLNLADESRNSPLLFLATLILSPWQSELLLFVIYSLLTSDTRIRVGFGCTIAKIPRPDRYFIYIWWYALNLVNINEDQNFCFRVLRQSDDDNEAKSTWLHHFGDILSTKMHKSTGISLHLCHRSWILPILMRTILLL